MMFVVAAVATVVVFAAGFVTGYKYLDRKMKPMELHGPHEHRCPCGNTWQHDDNMLPLGGIHEAHVCSSCGTVVLEISRHLEAADAHG